LEDTVSSLERYKKMFAESRDLGQQMRKESEIDDDYFHGYQWTAEERRILRERKQPDHVFNRIRPAVLGTLGVIKQGRTDPRAYPRNPQDEDSAEVASKVLRYIADEQQWDDKRIRGGQDYLISGWTAIEIGVDASKRITAEAISWEEFFFDQRSRREDFTDARFMGVARWVYADDLAAQFEIEPDKIAGVFEEALSDTFEDRPKDAQSNWVDRRQRRVLAVMMYHRHGAEWRRCLFYAGGILEEGPSPYVDGDGNPACGIEAQACFVDRENNRYGIVRDMRGPQDEINKRRSKLLNLLNNRQVQASNELAMNTDADEVRKEASRPDGVLPVGWQPVALNDLTGGQFSLLQEAKDEIERYGPNPAVLGRSGESSSGRAQLVRQQAGLTELTVIFGGLEQWELRVYRAMWSRARQFWDEPQFIRITDDDGAAEFVGINQPINGPAQVIMDPATGMPTIMPTVLGYENQLAELDVDITLDTVPDTANIAQEQFQALVDLARSGVQIPPQILIEASSLPKKREIIEKMSGDSEEGQQAAQEAAQAKEMAMAGQMAEIEETKSKAAKNNADAEASKAGSIIKAFEAGMNSQAV